MTEIMPHIENITGVEVEHFIRMLMQQDAAEGATSSEHGAYEDILRKWYDGGLSDEQAVEEAKQVSGGRQSNYH